LFHLTLGGGSAPLLASLFSALRAAVDGSPASECDPFGEDPELVRRVTPLLEFLYQHYWRVEVEGAEQLPQGPSIVLANQAGAIPLAGIVLPLVLRRSRPDLKPCRWLAEGSFLETPLMGRILARLGSVRASPENAVRILEDRHPVLVFPEGMQGISKPFSDRYQLRQFGRGGFVKLALRSGVPVVPTAWTGGGESMPLLARLPVELGGFPYLPVTTPPLPAKWRIKFGQPLDVRSFGLTSEDDSVGVSRVLDEIRNAVSGLLDTLLAQRTAVFA
jgi:1-acyl-sn-glycerol-3-phosphate acyltransferase